MAFARLPPSGRVAALLRRLWNTLFGKQHEFKESLDSDRLPEVQREGLPKGALVAVGYQDLPPPKARYALRTNQNKTYDIEDGAESVGFAWYLEGDEYNPTAWHVSIGEMSISFETLKDLRAWLGNAPIRRPFT